MTGECSKDFDAKPVYPPRLVSNHLDAALRLLLQAEALPPAAQKPPAIQPELVLVWLHVAGNLVWIGAAVAMGLILAAKEGDPKLRGALARKIHLRAAMPAFGVSFIAALLRTGMDLKGYFVQHHWMHGKLLFVLAVIAIHHILAARARKMEGGSMQEGGPSGMLTIVLTVSAILAAFFVVLRFPN
jgi:protoporphyrinogen IX oxidase